MGAAAAAPSPSPLTPPRTKGVDYRQKLQRYCAQSGAPPPKFEPSQESTSPFSAHVTVCVGAGSPIRFEGTGNNKKDAKMNAFYNAWLDTRQTTADLQI